MLVNIDAKLKSYCYNKNMEIRRLEQKDYEAFKALIETVVENLEVKEWLIVPTSGEMTNLLKDNKAEFWGMFDAGVLLSISCLSFDDDDFAEIIKLLKIENHKVAEISECMTLPIARGNNFMLKINKQIVKIAKDKGFDYLIATAHPDNIASNSSLKKLGMTVGGKFYRYGSHLRNYFVMKL